MHVLEKTLLRPDHLTYPVQRIEEVGERPGVRGILLIPVVAFYLAFVLDRRSGPQLLQLEVAISLALDGVFGAPSVFPVGVASVLIDQGAGRDGGREDCPDAEDTDDGEPGGTGIRCEEEHDGTLSDRLGNVSSRNLSRPTGVVDGTPSTGQVTLLKAGVPGLAKLAYAGVGLASRSLGPVHLR